MNCPHCGTYNPDGALYCSGCRRRLVVQRPPGASYASAQPAETCGMATASLIFGILGSICILPFIGSLVGLALGIMALAKINKSQGQLGGSGHAIAGIVISVVGFFTAPIVAAIVLPLLRMARQ